MLRLAIGRIMLLSWSTLGRLPLRVASRSAFIPSSTIEFVVDICSVIELFALWSAPPICILFELQRRQFSILRHERENPSSARLCGRLNRILCPSWNII